MKIPKKWNEIINYISKSEMRRRKIIYSTTEFTRYVHGELETLFPEGNVRLDADELADYIYIIRDADNVKMLFTCALKDVDISEAVGYYVYYENGKEELMSIRNQGIEFEYENTNGDVDCQTFGQIMLGISKMHIHPELIKKVDILASTNIKKGQKTSKHNELEAFENNDAIVLMKPDKVYSGRNLRNIIRDKKIEVDGFYRKQRVGKGLTETREIFVDNQTRHLKSIIRKSKNITL